VVTVYTTSLNIKKFYILHTENLFSFILVSGKTSQFSLNNPGRPAFVTQEASVYCAVGPGSLHKMEDVSSLNS
jgi:hypothetical protein